MPGIPAAFVEQSCPHEEHAAEREHVEQTQHQKASAADAGPDAEDHPKGVHLASIVEEQVA